MNDLKLVIRQLLKNPAFTVVAVLTLGFCIGANLTIFAVLDAILLRPLPFPEPERLVEIYNANPGAGIQRGKATIANYFERREAVEAFESVFMHREQDYTIGDAGSSRRVTCAEVTPEFFETLGVRLTVGEPFTDDHLGYDGANLVAILTDQYWRTYYDADPEVVGRRITINSAKAIVIGVLPQGFQYLSSKAEIYRPLAHHPEIRTAPGRHTEHASTFDGQMVARLAKNASMIEAQSQINHLNELWLSTDPIGQTLKETGFHTVVAPLHAEHVRPVKPMLLLVQAGVGFLLLMGGTNLSSLQLIRATGRSREIAIRKALGASRSRLAGATLLESTLLSLGGGALGVLIAVAGIRLVRDLGAALLPLGATIGFGYRAATTAIVASLLVGTCIAIPVIWNNLRGSPQLGLHGKTRGATIGRGTQQLRHGFLVAQIAIASVLLYGASLLGASLKQILDESSGFTSEPVLTGQITLPWIQYRGPSTKLPFVRRLLEEIRALPGVTHAAVSSAMPFTTEGSMARTILVDGKWTSTGGDLRAHYFSYVSPDYWNTMGISLLQGRFLEDSDLVDKPRDSPGVAVIDEAVARHYWPNGNALGSRFSTLLPETNQPQIHTVVGVVQNVKQTDLAETDQLGAIYEPYYFSTDFRLLIRASVPVNTLIPAVRNKVRDIDPAMPIDNFKTLQSYMDERLLTRTSPALLALIFAGVALVLAAVGTYGVLAYAVDQRRREIGLRMALGALPNQVIRQFLWLGLKMLGLGASFGFFGAWAAGRAMQSVLFQVSPFHVSTLAGTMAVMGVVTLMASLSPALRAARVDPMEALRNE